MVIAMTGTVCADQGISAVPGNVGITTQTDRVVDGIVMEQYSLAWQISNQSLARRTDDPMLGPDQVQYTTTYDATIISQGGLTSLVKDMSVNTDNRLIGQSNVKSGTAVTFTATRNGGNIVGEETMMLDGTGNTTPASDRVLCPFGSTARSVIPPYCNIVQVGSNYDLTIGSVAYTADERFVGIDASTPVVMNYNINVRPYTVTGQGTYPAMGMTSAFIKAHLQEGRGWNATRAVDLTYSDVSSTSGRISAFTKEMSYTSQASGSLSGGNHIIHASTRAIGAPHAFSTPTPGGAYISPRGDVQVPDHGSITFTVGTHGQTQGISTNNNGQALVFVDGVDQGRLYSYQFSDVTSDHTIVASPLL